MIERNLEDILSDVKYLDPLFLSQLQETLREIFDGKQKALSPEEAWKKCTAFFDNTELESLLRHVENDDIKADLDAIKPVIFLALYYYGKDFLYRSWIKQEENKDIPESEEMTPDEQKKYITRKRKSRGQLYNIFFVQKLRGENYAAKKKTDRVKNKVETYLKNILYTSYNHSNDIFNAKSSDSERPQLRLEYNVVTSRKATIKPLFQSELIGFIQKIYPLNEALLKLELPPEASEESFTRRTSKIDKAITERAKNSNYVTNVLSTMTAMIIDSLQCLSGHRNARGGLMTFEMITELDKIIREWIKYPYTAYDLPIKQRNSQPEHLKEKVITDKLLTNWAVEDLFKRQRFNNAIEKAFQCIYDYKVDIEDKKTQLKLLAVSSIFLFFPLPGWSQSYLDDFELIEKYIANYGNVNPKDFNNALKRLFLFIGFTFPSVIYIMCALVFSRQENEKLVPDIDRILEVTDALQKYLTEHCKDYDQYDVKNIKNTRNLKINTGRNTIEVFTTFEDKNAVKKRQQAQDRAPEPYLISSLNQQLSLLKYEEIFKTIMAEKYCKVFWDEIFMRKRVIQNPLLDVDYNIDYYFRTQITTFLFYINKQM